MSSQGFQGQEQTQSKSTNKLSKSNNKLNRQSEEKLQPIAETSLGKWEGQTLKSHGDVSRNGPLQGAYTSPRLRVRQGSTVLELSNQKKQAELEAKLLQNRIKILKQEQDKLNSKIETTNRRAAQILEIKKNNEARAKRLADQQEELEIKTKEKQLKILKERKHRKMLLEQQKFMQLENLQKNGKDTYLEKQMFTQLKYQIKNEEIINKQKIRNRLKQQEIQTLEKNQLRRHMNIMSFQENYSQRANSVMQGLQKEKSKIKTLERAERDILDKLHYTQKREQEAFVTLQEAISGSITSHKQRLESKHSRNLQIRKDYFKAPTFDHLESTMKEIEDGSKQFRSMVQLQPLEEARTNRGKKGSSSAITLPSGGKFQHVTINRGSNNILMKPKPLDIPQKTKTLDNIQIKIDNLDPPKLISPSSIAFVSSPNAFVCNIVSLSSEFDHVTLNHSGKFPFFEGQSITIQGKPSYKITSSALGDMKDGKTLSIQAAKGVFKIDQKVNINGPYGSVFQDMNCNAVMIGPDATLFRSLLMRFFNDNDFNGTCWLITSDQLYTEDFKKLKEKAGDKLRLQEEPEMWENAPQIYDSGAKDLDADIIQKAKKDKRYHQV